jgi:hypothetical protein
MLSTCTHHHILFIRVDLLVLVLLLLLSRSDILNLTHTLATSGSVWVISLGRGEMIANTNFVASSASEFQFGSTSTVVADHFVKYLVVAELSTSFHPVYDIVLTVLGERGERFKA